MMADIRLKLKLIFVPVDDNNYRPKFLESRILIWCLLVLFVLKLATIPFLIYFPKSIFFSAIVKTTLIELLNQERKSSGLQSLKENAALDNAAVLKARDILEKDYFSHQSPEGVAPWHWFKIAGYNYKFAGENLGIGFLDSGELNQSWLDSPSHRANLLNSDYKDVGIAILKGDFQGNETTVVVQLFGTAQASASAPKVQTKEEVNPVKNNISNEVKKETVAAEPEKMEIKGDSFSSASSETNEFVSATKEPVPALKEFQEKAVFGLFSFLNSDYQKILQVIIYGFLSLIILALIINIFVRMDIQHVDLILKTLGFIAVLVLFILIDKGALIKMIPHNFYIY